MNRDSKRWERAAIRRVAAMIATSPALRAFTLHVLNRVPPVKRRLKRALARADTIASQSAGVNPYGDADDMLLSCEARRALRDLREEHARAGAERGAAGGR